MSLASFIEHNAFLWYTSHQLPLILFSALPQSRFWGKNSNASSWCGRWSQEVLVKGMKKWDRDGKEANIGCVFFQVGYHCGQKFPPSGDSGIPCKTPTSELSSLMGEEAGIFIHQLPVHYWLRVASGGLNSLALLACLVCGPNMFLPPGKKKKKPSGRKLQVFKVSSFWCASGECQERRVRHWQHRLHPAPPSERTKPSYTTKQLQRGASRASVVRAWDDSQDNEARVPVGEF